MSTSYLPYLGLLPLLLMPLFWVLVCRLLATVSGWRRLVAHFGALPGPVPESRSVPWARVGPVSYKGVLRISLQEQGLILSVMGLFRPGHPPVFIPRSVLGRPEGRHVPFSDFVQIGIGDPRITTLTLPPEFVRDTFLDPATNVVP